MLYFKKIYAKEGKIWGGNRLNFQKNLEKKIVRLTYVLLRGLSLTIKSLKMQNGN